MTRTTATFRRTLTASTAAGLILIAIAGCTSTPGMGTITGTGGGEGLVFSANGSTGDGADDVQVTVDHSSIDGTAPTTESTIVPWKTGTGAYDLDKPKTVTMQVQSLAKTGWASCEIRWSGKSISNKATGDHAQANCTATLGYPWSKTDD